MVVLVRIPTAVVSGRVGEGVGKVVGGGSQEVVGVSQVWI